MSPAASTVNSVAPAGNLFRCSTNAAASRYSWSVSVPGVPGRHVALHLVEERADLRLAEILDEAGPDQRRASARRRSGSRIRPSSGRWQVTQLAS